MIDKESLFAPGRLLEDDVEVPGLGTVRVRALSRRETIQISGLPKLQADAHTIACGLVNPSLSVEEVHRWQQVSPPGEIEPVSRRIAELSGLMQGAAKSDLPGDGVGPEQGV